MEIKKNYFVDTSVLLYDREAIHAFRGNNVILAMQVLDEIDKFKTKEGILGENSRYVNRFLDSLRTEGKSLSDGIYSKNDDITYRVLHHQTQLESNKLSVLPFDLSVPDNKIILSALRMSQDASDGPIIVVTKDINMRVKCDALGITAEDYYKDRISDKNFDGSSSVWSGQTEVIIADSEIDYLYSNGEITLPTGDWYPNTLLTIRSESSRQKTALARVGSDAKTAIGFQPITSKDSAKKSTKKMESQKPIVPYDKEQAFALECLSMPAADLPLVSITGTPGSGKTFLTLLTAISLVLEGKYERLVFTRSIQPVGKDIGFLPGDIKEKMAPWLGPITDNFRHAFKDMTYFDMMLQKGQIDIAPLSYIRGRSFPNAFIIVDEAQNATIHELKTIITRAGENSKLVLMGDIEQIDTPYIDKYSNGLSVVVDRFKTSPLAAHIHLNRGRRSDLANEANRLL